MTATGLERALGGALLLDAAFCEGFFLPLSPMEVDALSRLSRAAIARFRESLHPSLRRHLLRDAAAHRDSAVRRRREDEP
jgi:hypothetical protein